MRSTRRTINIVTVFSDASDGGNPAPIVVDADGMSDDEMREIARRFGHESAFVLTAPDGSRCEYALRFWVPNHEMEMCGHATIGSVWLLDRLGRDRRDVLSLDTVSGVVDARLRRDEGSTSVEIAQPEGHTDVLLDADRDEILSVLGIEPDALAPRPIRNARTSRTKTLVPMRTVAALDELRPDFERVEAVCEQIGSTGFYPYAVADGSARIFDARQFPKSSGYPEDPATGIAAAALIFGLLADKLVAADARPIFVRQGRAMGRASQIELKFRLDDGGKVRGVWLGGAVRLDRVFD